MNCTAPEALAIVFELVARFREEGDADLRSVLHCVSGIRALVVKGKTAAEIRSEYVSDNEDEV